MAKRKTKLDNYHVLGLLDKTTRLVATACSFNIEVKVETGKGEVSWIGKYYYSDLSSAIRGFAKYKAKKMGKKFSGSKDLLNLLELVAALDSTIVAVGKKLEKAWLKNKSFDPVERENESSR